MTSELFLIKNNENYFSNHSKDENNLIGDRCIEEMDKIIISFLEVVSQFCEIFWYDSRTLNLSEMTNIIPGWYNQYASHEDISSYDSILDISNTNTRIGYIYTDTRKNEYQEWKPYHEQCKNPRSLYDHEFLVSFLDEAVYQFSFSRYAKWLKKPRIDNMKWYHSGYDTHFLRFSRQ